MILDRLEVESFGCVVKAEVELGPGLNVLYGPNDLGKSTLAQAVRAALLLQHKSREHERFKPWHADSVPTVRLAFTGDDGKHWRVRKTFDYSSRGSSTLEWSPDGVHWSSDKKGREVDGELRKMLGWGVGEVGGRAAPRGFPPSFLATALLGEHADVHAVFDGDLHKDGDDTGRSRLTEALQALAEDPRFKAVLLRASAKVEEAKSATGRWKTGRDSPMAKIRERIETLQAEIDELGKAAHTSAEVQERLGKLEGQRMEIAEALVDAEARAVELAAARAGGQRWQEAARRDESARARLAAITEERARARALEAGIAEVQVALDAAQAALAAAVEREHAASERARAAEAALRSACEGDDEVARERQSHEHRVRTLELELAELQRSQRDVTQTIECITAAREAAEELERMRAALAGIGEACDAATAELTASERELSSLDEVALVHARREAETRLVQAERAAIDAAALRAQGARHRDAATRARAAADTAGLPGPDELATLRALERALERAEGKVSLGVAVRLHLETPLDLHVATDGGPRRPAKTETTFAAQRGLSLELGSVGRIDVAVGDEGARAELEAARVRWRDEAQPTLERLGVDSIAALERAIAKADELRREAEREELAAAGAEARASALDATAATLLDRRAEVEGYDAALAKVDAAAHERASRLDAAGLARARTEASDAIAKARARLQAAEGDRAAQQGRTLHAEERTARAAAQEQDARARLADDPFRIAAGLESRHPALLAELADARAAAQRLHDDAAAALERATASSSSAADAVAAATRDREAVGAHASALRDRFAADRARLDEIARRCTAEHEAAARAEVDATARELAAIPAPGRIVTDDDLAAANAELESLRARAAEVATELSKAEGMLEQVGGGVIQEKEQRSKAALDDAKRHETELYLEYEAWELLRDTLKRVEAVEGRHLGHALTLAIEQRLVALTAGRYARLELDRDLKTGGLRAAGAARAIETLSEGLKEQLATLVRLAIAEHMKSVVILDDHLAQTDVDRVEFFRGLLREVAKDVQIIVLTCRPLDYLAAEELAGQTSFATSDDCRLRAIDLSRVIERATVSAKP